MVNFAEIISRVTIRDILAEAGFYPDSNRMPCPIHDGSNKTSFAFTDYCFICHSCGAKGGLVALVQYLHRCNKADAMRILCQLAGLPHDNSGNSNIDRPKLRLPLIRGESSLFNREYQEVRECLRLLELYQYALETNLRIINSTVQNGEMPLVDFYTEELIYLQKLENLDSKIIEVKYQLSRIKRKFNCDKNTRPCGQR